MLTVDVAFWCGSSRLCRNPVVPMSLGWLALCLCSDATDPNLCFQIAVENGFGGAYGREKADWLVDVVQQYFHDNCKYVSWQPLATCSRREAANWAPRRSLSFLGPGCAPHSEKGARLLPMSSLRHLCGTRRARSGPGDPNGRAFPRRRASRAHSPNSRPMSSRAAGPRALTDRPPASIGPAVKGQLGGKKGDGCGQTAFAASRWRADVVGVALRRRVALIHSSPAQSCPRLFGLAAFQK